MKTHNYWCRCLKTMEPSKNPWGVHASKAKKWEEYDTEHGSPFALMAEIITNWPGTRPTSEMHYKIRHRRLVEMIAGYPEIVTGKRPLDVPTHHRSIDALKLSLYLDGIENKFVKDSEWHSLRTSLLDWDLLDENLQFESIHKTYLACLIHHVEKFENSEENEEYQNDRSNFLRALHSYHSSREGCWPHEKELTTRGPDNLSEVDKLRLDAPPLGDESKEESSSEKDEQTFIEHSIKFEKIQSWIKWHCYQNEVQSPLNSNIRQNMHLGASAILEGVFARIRSKVLAEKRPGSITVDGGGRICYISNHTPAQEEKWIQETIHQSLDLDPNHLHPYNEKIIESIKQWGKKTKKAYLKDKTGKKIEYLDNETQFEQMDQNREAFWRDFLTENLRHITDKYYPSPSFHVKKVSESSGQVSGFNGFKDQYCRFCNGADQTKKHSNLEQFLDSCEPNADGVKNQVCVFHYVLFELGNAVKIRQLSQKSKSIFVRRKGQNQHRIHHVIHLDGNGIGQIFTRDYSAIDQPSIHQSNPAKEDFEKMIIPFWEKHEKEIVDLKRPWEDVERLFEDMFENSLKEYPKLSKTLRKRRVQTYLQRKRRSFDFNVNWWVSFHEGVFSNRENYLEPWVAAGDDLILVNRKTEDTQEVVKTLIQFQDKLLNNFKESVPISFGVGIAKKGKQDSDLSVTIQQSHAAEKSAKHSWKDLILKNEKLAWLVKESAKLSHNPQERPPGWDFYRKEVLENSNGAPSVIHIWQDFES